MKPRLAVAVALLTLVCVRSVAAEAPQIKHPETFHLILLVAETKPGGVTPGLPPGAAKALADASGFLPFKSFRLLDMTLVKGTLNTASTTSIRGEEGTIYRASVASYGTDATPSQMRVRLYDANAPKDALPLIDGSFEMNVGETVVVGTSRQTGSERALIVLLTALEPKQKRDD